MDDDNEEVARLLHILEYGWNFWSLPFRAQFVLHPAWAIYMIYRRRCCRVREGMTLFGDHRGWGRLRWLYLWPLIPLGAMAGLGPPARSKEFVREFMADIRGRR